MKALVMFDFIKQLQITIPTLSPKADLPEAKHENLDSQQNRKKNKLSAKKIWLLGIVYSSFLIVHLLRTAYDNDELEHLHASWLVSIGQKPFTDFVEQHNHLIWYLLSPLLSAFPDQIFVVATIVRFLDLGLLLLSGFVLWKLFRLFFNLRITKWLMLLLSANVMFVHHMIEFRPDPMMSALLFFGFFFWARYFLQGRFLDMAASGFFVGLAVVILQKALVFWLMMVGLLGLAFIFAPWWQLQRTKILQASLGFFLASVMPMGLFLLWTAHTINFADYWFWNFPFNQFFYLHAHVYHHFPWYQKVGQNLLECFVTWPLGIMGLVAVIKWHKRDFALVSFAAMVLAYFMGFMRSRFPLAQYLLPFFPLLALLAGAWLSRLETQAPKRFAVVSAFIVFTLIECGVILWCYPKNTHQLAGMNFVLQNTAQTETVFLQPPLNPIFRVDASYFWYNNGPIQNALQDYETTYGVQTDWIAKDQIRWFSNPPKFVRYDPAKDYKFFARTKTWVENYIPLTHHELMQRPEASQP